MQQNQPGVRLSYEVDPSGREERVLISRIFTAPDGRQAAFPCGILRLDTLIKVSALRGRFAKEAASRG